MNVNFGSYILYGDAGIADGTDAGEQIIIGDDAWRHVAISEYSIIIDGLGGDDYIEIEPPENGYFERYGGRSRVFDVWGSDGNDTFIINSSSTRRFEGDIWGDEGIDVIEEDIVADLRNWTINPLKSGSGMVHFYNTKKGAFLDIQRSTEAIGSGNSWFLTKDLNQNILEPKTYQSVIDDEIITGEAKSRDLLEGGAGSDEFMFGSLFGRWDKRHIGKYADTIIDFNPSEGDQLSFSSESFTRLSRGQTPSIGYAERKKDLKPLYRDGYDFIYFQSKGKLYYDSNGNEAGLGKKGDCGGLLVKLLGNPEIYDSHLIVI